MEIIMNEQAKKMRAVGREISLCMGISMSFFLSLTGNLLGGHFTISGFIISFVVSTVIRLIIGFLVPMKNVTEAARNLFHLKPGSITGRCVESLTSDLIYTPIMTLIMVFLAWRQANAQAPVAVPFLPMFLPSFGVCMVVGFVLIMILMPIFTKMAFKHQGIQMPPSGGRPDPGR